MEKQDIIIKCATIGCNQERVFTAKDQAFFEEKGFTKPKYCREHSAARKQRHEAKLLEAGSRYSQSQDAE